MIRKRLVRAGLCAVALTLVVGAFAGGASATRFTPGSSGLGDPFFPLAGNGGYDVQKYTLKLDYDPATDRLVGTATIVAEATHGLKSFNLDLRDFLTVTSIRTGTKQGFKMEAAEWAHSGQELTVFPREKPREGTQFSVVVEYSGVVVPITDPDDSIEGFIPTDDGAFVVNEPQGSPGWYPANDNPKDKALFDISVTVPEGLTALANGRLVSTSTANGKTTWNWSQSVPMAPYLATATNGRFDLVVTTLPDGTPNYVAVDSLITSSRAVLANIPAMQAYFSSIYGPVPARCDRRDRRPCRVRRVRARDPVEGELPGDAELGHARARDRARVVRQLGLAEDLAGHVAQRGLRPVLGVDVDGEPRHADRGPGIHDGL